MSKKTDELLAKAKSLNNPELTDAIEALEFLKDEATANHQEYKDLVELVEIADVPVEEDDVAEEVDVDAEVEVEAEAEDEPEQEESDANEADDDVTVEEVAKESKKLSYAGVKMIGAFWYSKQDGYKERFATADECAKHFNEE